jgi:hypothetical protein
MKRVVLFFVFLVTLGLGSGMATVHGWVFQDQEEELIPSEDSVSIDDSDPIFYEAVEDEAVMEEESGNSTKLIIGAVGLVVLLGLGYLFISRSRSQKEK